MKCNKIERLLNQYVDNELLEQKIPIVKSHLDGCPNCTEKYNELITLKGIIKTQISYEANPFLWTRISSTITQKPILVGVGLIPKILKVWIALASVLIVISGSTLFYLNNKTSSANTEEPTVEKAILEIPNLPGNMERITLNLMIYTNKKMEANYGLF